jgi:anti-sigma B factor antagonist
MAAIHERALLGADQSDASGVSISACPDADGVVVVEPATELDAFTCPALHRYLIEQLDLTTCRALVIDLTCVEFLGAAGLEVLAVVNDHAELRGVELRLVVSSRVVWRPLRLTGLASRFAIYADLEQALPADHRFGTREGTVRS